MKKLNKRLWGMNNEEDFGLILLMLLTAGMMVGCSGAADEGKRKQQTNHAQHEAFPITIKDASGEKVTIEEKPKKIVSLIPSNTEGVFALGLGKKGRWCFRQ